MLPIDERQKMNVPYSMDGKNVSVPLASWEVVKNDPDRDTFDDLMKFAIETVDGGGAFIVYRESDSAIMHRCDRITEVDELFGA